MPNTISNKDKKFLKDAMTMALEDANSLSDSDKKFLNKIKLNKAKFNPTSSANSLSNRDIKFLKDAAEDVKSANTISNKDVQTLKDAGTNKNMGGTMKKYNMGGTMKNYRAGGIEAADKEGSRLSISMERQEDAGYSPSEADFDQQNRLAAEGIMEVGADVKIIQGHNSRASLGETEGVRGTGAMVRGTKFVGVL